MEIKSEWDLINNISKKISSRGLPLPDEMIMGIGDDCAVYQIDKNRYGLFTTDISIESKHFIIELTTPENIGYKAMSANLSDIAAMGGYPKFAFVSLGIPKNIDENYISSIYDGILEAASNSNAVIAGGDTSKAEQLIVNIAIYGEICGRKPVFRNTAQTGDTIYVTGALGDSKAGLEILIENSIDEKIAFPSLVKKHLHPSCRLDLVDHIINDYDPTAMIDISDGTLSDLRHICDKSDKGFNIQYNMIPISENLNKYCSHTDKDPYKLALESGEEFELLFTSKNKPYKSSSGNSKKGITPIGEITDSGFYIIDKDKRKEASITGFDHFF